MPREDEDIELTPRKRLEELLELLEQSAGCSVERLPDRTVRISGTRSGGHGGGLHYLTIVDNPGIEDLALLNTALVKAGWLWEEARAHVQARAMLYAKQEALFPRGGYPKEDRVITRAQARAMIRLTDECGCNWRPPKPSVIKKYTKRMDQGIWRWCHPQPLILSREHQCVLDGRQRLESMLKAGLPEMGFSVVLDFPKEEFKYLDLGSPRSVSDVLAGAGLSARVRSKVGPAVMLAMRFDSGVPWKSWKDLQYDGPEVSEALFPGDPKLGIAPGPYAEMPGKPYNDALTLGWDSQTNTGCKMLPSSAAALSFLIRRDYAQPDALQKWEEFRTALVYGDNLPRGDARAALRAQMLVRDTGIKKRYESAVQLGAGLLTWALWLNEIPVQQIKFGETQKMPYVWNPGMKLPGRDPRYAAKQRAARLAAKEQQGALDVEFDESDDE